MTHNLSSELRARGAPCESFKRKLKNGSTFLFLASSRKNCAGGRRYWFWTCEGDDETARNNWYTKIQKIIKSVDKQKPFLHSVSPHSFRHTFSISHLNAGTDIKFVSRWLGHKSVTITEKHYSHAIRGTMLASEEAYDASMERQAGIRSRSGARGSA